MRTIFQASPIPRYVQLSDLFRQRISRGIWPPGHKLPTLEDLMREFDVARVTVRQAVDVLAREGLLLAERGRGTFVTVHRLREKQLHLATTLKELSHLYRNDKPKLTLLEESSAIPSLKPKDGKLARGYHFLRRVHSRDDEPYCIISIYLDEHVFRRAPLQFRSKTVIEVLLDLKVRIAYAHQTLRISTADIETARQLSVPLNAPMAEVRRVFRAPDGIVIYLAEVTYRGDYIHLEMDLKP